MDRLRAIELFLAVARSGSFSAVAGQVGVTPQAVSKAVRELERGVGATLLIRTTRRLRLTEEGLRFRDRVAEGVQAIDAAWAAASEESAEVEGRVCITSTPAVGRRLIQPIVGEVQRRHPKLVVELRLEDRFTDLVADGIDLGVRVGFPPDAQLVVRELFRMQLLTLASPAYLARHGVPRTPDALAGHACTGSRQPNSGRLEPWEFRDGDGVMFRDVPSRFVTNDIEAELQAVIDGWGIGQLDSVIASAPVRAGALKVLMPERISERFGVYLYFPRLAAQPRRVRVLIDALVAGLQGGRDFRLSASALKAAAPRR